MPEPEISWSPWTDAEVASLNDFQTSGVMHEFTCGGFHDKHVALVATNDGWVCPQGCDYLQTWAHKFMTDRSWEILKSS